MSHTPGPWKVVDRWYVWTDDDVGCEVAKVCDENLDDDTLVQADADARLIAAAPELLHELQHLLSMWEEAIGWKPDYMDMADSARKVIAKATGSVSPKE